MPIVLVEPPHPDGRRPVTVVQFVVGATGAANGRNGTDARDPSFSNMANNPIETVEAEAAVTILEYGIRSDSGGPGRWRGGAGQMISFQVHRDGCQLLARGLERLRFPPWGAAGGRASRITRVVLNLGTERERDLGKLEMVEVACGDVVTALMSGAGGCGDPFERVPEQVLTDVRRGVVSVEGACEDYGVVVSDGCLDVAATNDRRSRRAETSANGSTSGGFDFGSERAAWESVFTEERTARLDDRLANLPSHDRQRRRHELFRALEPKLMIPATQERHEFTKLFEDPDVVGKRLDTLLDAGWD